MITKTEIQTFVNHCKIKLYPTLLVQAAIGRNLSMEECQELLIAAHAELVRDYPMLTPRSLDHQIWVWQRQAP